MNCIKLGKLMLEVDIKHFQVRALADINGLQTRNYNPQIEMFARFKMKSSFHKTKRII